MISSLSSTQNLPSASPPTASAVLLYLAAYQYLLQLLKSLVMPSSRERRLLKELSDIQKDAVDSGITVEPPNPADLTYMVGYVPGPPDTPYVGGTFKVEIKIPENYPFKPPSMKFLTQVWHPNISSQTVCCLRACGRGDVTDEYRNRA